MDRAITPPLSGETSGFTPAWSSTPFGGTNGADGVLDCSYFHDGAPIPQVTLTLLRRPDFAASTAALRQHLPRKYRALVSAAVAAVKSHGQGSPDSRPASAPGSLSLAELLLVCRELHRSAAARFGDDITRELNAFLMALSLEDEDDRQEERDEQEASAREELDLIPLVGAFGKFDPITDSPPPTGYDERRALASTRLLI